MRAIGALVAVFALTSAARADVTDNKKKADELFLQGRDLLDKDPGSACAKFLDAQKLEPNNVAIMLNLGTCFDKQGKNASALRWYRKTVTAATETKDPSAKDYVDAATERTSALSGQVSSITFNVDQLQPDALLFIDGETIPRSELVVEVDKGTHTVEARLPGKKTSSEQINVESNDKKLTYSFKPLVDAPIVGNRRRRRLMGAVVGGGIVVVTSVATALWARSIRDGFECTSCTTEPEKDKAYADDQRPPTYVFIGGVALGVGVAAYFFFTSPPGERQEESRRSALVPTVSPSGLGLSWARRF